MGSDLFDLGGRVAVVTGGGTGLGKGIATGLAQAGALVILAGRRQDVVEQATAEIRAGGGRAEGVALDVTRFSELPAFFETVSSRHGALDILVNNAGVGLGGDFLSTSIEDWQWVIGINLMGVVHGCKLFAPAMVERGHGHIVNIASAAGYYAAPDMTAYSASKHAVMGLSESLRAELAPRGIGVSAICPGIINTNIVASGRMRGSTGAAQDKIAALYRRRNYGPELVADAIVGAIEHNRAVTPVSPEAWMLYGAKRFTPGILDWMGRSPMMKRFRP